MDHAITPLSSYRAYLRPAGLSAEAGALPFIQVRAANAEHAMRAAHAVSGQPVERVEHLNPPAAHCLWVLGARPTAGKSTLPSPLAPARAAHAVSGQPVDSVERLEPVEA